MPTEPGFEPWVDARRPALWRAAWLLTGDDQKAEDLVQTALLKVWPCWGRLVAAGNPEAYVRRVMYTTYLAWWHRRWTSEVPTGVLPEREAAADTDPQRVDVAAALATLTKGQRAVVVCRFFEDLSVHDTARQLNVSEGTVKSQTSRALAALRGSPLLRDERTRERP